ncbi:MAG: hypothetical protein IKD09_04980 [Lentisphaeria bacterium]|nr:hypothetical protein [Lentisphaeria bacterium]
MNYEWCRACGTTTYEPKTARKLDASSLSLLCMTVGNFCCDGRAIPNS